MSMKEYSIAIGEMLSKEQFAFNPKKRASTKKVGDKTVVVDINKEDVYFFGGDAGNIYDDPDGVLKEIQGKIDGIMNMLAGKTQPTQTPDTVEPEIVEPELEPAEQHVINVDAPKVVEPAQPPNVPQAAPVLPPQPYKNPSYVSSVPKELSIETIKKYINDKVTDEEAYVFLQVCRARNLNPFTGDVHLIKYDHLKPATMVVGKDAFMKRAEMHPQYDGFEAGIIVESNDEHFTIVDENRIGTFIRSNEILLGGWAKVYRKDRTHHTEISVSLSEFNTGKSSWAKMPATMIRKVALVSALREAFPSELSGLYDISEMGVET